MKKRTKIILGLIGGIVVLGGGYLTYLFVYRPLNHPKAEKIETNTKAASFTIEELTDKLKDYKDFYELWENSEVFQEKDHGTYVIPGLDTTKTINSKTFIMEGCTSMTPQGLAVTDDYLFISSYCHTHDHNSVVYMLDQKTGKLIKEIVLPDKSHVGGLAYDPENMLLWISGYENKISYTNAYTLQQMLDYKLDSTKQPLQYSYKVPLYTLKRNSFMTYDKNHLYAGYFNKDDDGDIQQFDLEDNGTPKNYRQDEVKEKSVDINGKLALPITLSIIAPKVQGITFYKDYMFMSQSYGLMNSQLKLFDETALGEDGYVFNDETALFGLELPTKLEQIYIHGDKIYMLFEAASYAYRTRPTLNVDRILVLDMKEKVEEIDRIRALEKENSTEKKPTLEETFDMDVYMKETGDDADQVKNGGQETAPEEENAEENTDDNTDNDTEEDTGE